jgi:hypothetical protein
MSYGRVVESTPERPGWPAARGTTELLDGLMAEHRIVPQLDGIQRLANTTDLGIVVVRHYLHSHRNDLWSGLRFRRPTASGLIEVTQETSGRHRVTGEYVPPVYASYGNFARYVMHPGDTRVVELSVNDDDPPYTDSLDDALNRLASLSEWSYQDPVLATDSAIMTARALQHPQLRAEALRLLGLEATTGVT